jgi:hypothetical protein
MLVFVVPLKSQKTSKSWEYTSKLFDRCVRSLCNQTSSEFRVVVVCHEKPNITFNHSHIFYSQANFPPPELTTGDGPMLEDRTRKVMIGLYLAQDYHPSHVMVVDADDCVSNQLAEFVSQRPQSNGWFVNDGYRYIDGEKRILPQEKLYRLCGTSIITRSDLYELPKNLDDCMDYNAAVKYHINHFEAVEIMARRGEALEPLPFAGSIYVSPANKDNLFNIISIDRKLRQNPKMILSPIKKSLLMTFRSQPITESIRRQFSLDVPCDLNV